MQGNKLLLSSNIKKRTLPVLLLLLTLSGCFLFEKPDLWHDALTTHTFVLKEDSILELVWVQTVFSQGPVYSRALGTINGIVFFVGSLSQSDPGGLIALDSKTGNELWQIQEVDTLDVGTDFFYVDYRASVVAYDVNKEKIWQAKLPGARNVDYIQAIDGKLYVSTGDFYLLDASSGTLLASSQFPDIFDFNPELVRYFLNSPEITDRRVYFRTGDIHSVVGAAVAMNRENGNILWKTDENVISNVTATESLVFVITYEDELHILDAVTGKLLKKIKIEPSINFFDQELYAHAEGYQIAVDEVNQMLYVLLGDSNQLFAFRIKSGK